MNMNISVNAKTLLFAGAVLFLVGLAQGVVIMNFANPRMGLSAHLTAVQCGMALMIFGLAWPFVRLGRGLLKAAMWSGIFGMYVVWAAITLGAIVGISRALPIAGQGFSAGPVMELVVQTIVTIGGVSCLVSGGFITAGLWLSLKDHQSESEDVPISKKCK
jgi:(hydroxyamino)benzene mutase